MVKKQLQLSKHNGLNPLMLNVRKSMGCITVKDFFELHDKFIEFKVLEGLSSRSINDYKTHIEFIRRFFEEAERISIDRLVDADLLRSYLYHMVQERQYKPGTVNIRLRTLKCYLKWLFDEGYTDTNFSLKLKLVKVPQDTIRPLSDADVKKMLNAPDKGSYAGFRDFVLMILMLDCGIRINEAANLKNDDIDLKQGLINIRAENAKTRVFRQVPINAKTCKLIKELIRIAEDNKSEYIFQSIYGDKMKTNQVIQNFERYGKRSGVTVKCTPHIFRHTFATNAVKAGMDAFTLQRILGHSTLAMCRKYIQLETTDIVKKHKQINLLDKYLK